MNKIYEGLIQRLKKNGCGYSIDEPMSMHTSFKIGGPADLFIKPNSSTIAADVKNYCMEHKIPCYVIGKGTNLLVSDEGIRGAVICIGNEISTITRQGCLVTAQAGASLTALCGFAKEHSLSGLEFAFGIPGSVGGAVFMNAGAFGKEMSDVLVSVDVISSSGELFNIKNQEAQFGYRKSSFQDSRRIIASATYLLTPDDRHDISGRMQEHSAARTKKQPLEYPSAGSTFKRPIKGYASQLIDICGLKGLRLGDAMVSEKHAGFIVNLGNASCSDVLRLCEIVKNTVAQKTGIVLDTEIKII